MRQAKRLAFLLLLCVLFLFGGCVSQPSPAPENPSGSGEQGSAAESADEVPAGGYLKVHFIDVGQGDSILIQCGDEAMLVDAGTNESEDLVAQYLQSQKIRRLSYVIGTHPHEDHIGGLDAVIRQFDVDTVLLPDASHTTRTYEDVLDALLDKELSVTLPCPGDVYRLGGASFTILSPDEATSKEASAQGNLNNFSIGIRLEYGSTAFVMCGDAETASEEAMIKSGLNLQANVLKVSHHGSSTSTSDAFLEAVGCQYAVISCGKDNSYGHPHQEILDKCSAAHIRVFRTDESGTILAVSDGSGITWQLGGETLPETQTEAEANRFPEEPQGAYVLNQNTMKFHLPDCSSTESIAPDNRLDYQGSREELLRQGYSPCGICNP